MSHPSFPQQRWHIHPSDGDRVRHLSQDLQILAPVVQVLFNRGLDSLEAVQTFLDPDSLVLPSPLTEFEDLAISVELLATAIAQQQTIAICGDYDADGMTSTALLLRALRFLGGQVDYAIPSRMQEGYGINSRIVEDFHQEGVSLILTVDNGIAAYDPIARARELGLGVIVTDHHDLPPKLPPANAILNPKLLPETSLYRGLAGVGVAYILALTLAQHLGQSEAVMKPLLELFTLGTIADLAPLTGVNRCWVKRGLALLPDSQLLGVQVLLEEAGIKTPAPGQQLDLAVTDQPVMGQPASPPTASASPTLKPEDIGFRLGPRINAIGRIGDPQVVIELLTTDDPLVARQRAKECEAANQQRRQLCEDIEQEAIALAEEQRSHLADRRILLVVSPHWHHGVIGIVASRLVERYGVPVFIATGEEGGQIRGSARGIPEFHVAQALDYCTDLLLKHGGHQAAGGFSLPQENLEAFHQRLIGFARQSLTLDHVKPLVTVDAALSFDQINGELYGQIDALHPWGIANPEPVFWSPQVRILEQRKIGKEGHHLKLTLGMATGPQMTILKAVVWRWGEYFPLPDTIDIAYRLRENTWKGRVTVELELLGVRWPDGVTVPESPPDLVVGVPPSKPPSPGGSVPLLPRPPQTEDNPGGTIATVAFTFSDRPYSCAVYDCNGIQELRIRNGQGQVLAVQAGQTTGLLGHDRATAQTINVQEPFFYNLIQGAVAALKPHI